MWMERKGSFSLKSTRFLFLAISSSFLFCVLLYYCVLNIAPLLPRRTHFQLSSCNKTTEPSFGETFVLEAANASQQTFDLTLAGKDVVFADIRVEENGNVSGEVLDLSSGEKEVRGNVSSQEVVESVEPSDAANLGISSLKNGSEVLQKNQDSNASRIAGENHEKIRDSDVYKIKIDVERECDIYDGEWVFYESYPLYGSKLCPFIDEGFSCEVNGRTDLDYMKWRWKPRQCDIPRKCRTEYLKRKHAEGILRGNLSSFTPNNLVRKFVMLRFNPVKMLELIRGKRLVFVGDSINRNQWESMMCILQQAVLDPKQIYEAHGRRITKERGQYNFKFVDYNCSVEYYVTHFLVHESKARVNTKRIQTLRIDTVDKRASKWRGADMFLTLPIGGPTTRQNQGKISNLVYLLGSLTCAGTRVVSYHFHSCAITNSGSAGTLNCVHCLVLVNYYQEGNMVHPRLDVSTAFHKSLKTWAWWVDHYVNPIKTQVFFRSSSPSHFSGGEWNTGGHCKEHKQPLNFTSRKQVPIPGMNLILQQVVDQMTTPVTVLNITNLSGLRIDGHPSIYGRKPVIGTRRSDIQDCSHWCLPGVPDTWNELLYYHIVARQRSLAKR